MLLNLFKKRRDVTNVWSTLCNVINVDLRHQLQYTHHKTTYEVHVWDKWI